jgi:protein tyrosine/serine phosphatase
LIHCSAGIHRTGMIANALLRSLGLTADEAKAGLLTMRQVTHDGVGEHRLAWGEQFS